MPFAVFRRHQRNLIAIFAILAMIGFVLSDTMERWGNSGAGRSENAEIAELYGKPVLRADLFRINQQRQRANRFLSLASPGVPPNYFGGTTTRELVDALILEHQADELGLPKDARLANEWLTRVTNGAMNSQSFEFILSRFGSEVGGEELLTDLASQIRIQQAQQAIASPLITPLDVFRTYRDQSERASFKVVPVVVDGFLDKVGEPSDAQVRALYDRGKDVLPDPNSPDPGFKEPRRVKVEVLSVNVADLAKKIKDTLSEADLKAYYEARKTDFPVDSELPVDLFQGEPGLTPARYVPFSELRDTLAAARSRELAEEQVNDKFAKIRDDVIDAFSDKYHEVEDDIADARKQGETINAPLPTPTDLAAVARENGLEYETTPLLDKDQAESHGRLSEARVSLGQAADKRDFADMAFDPKLPLYDSFELVDVLGWRYLCRRIVDEPAHVEPLDKIRPQVVRAWKVEQARPMAKKTAEEFAARIKAEGGTIKGLTFETRPVVDIPAVTKLKPGMPMPPQFPGDFHFERGPATPTELPQIPQAGKNLVDALFGLKAGEVAVAPDLPQKTYYVMALERRDPANFATLFGTNGSLATYYGETRTDLLRENYAEGIARLREEAGLKPDWAPPDEDRNEQAAE